MRPRTWLLGLVTIVAAVFLVLAVGCEEQAPEVSKYPGARDVQSGSRATFPIGVPGEQALEPDKYEKNMRYKAFETDDSADQVLDFYNKSFQGWETELSLDMDEAGMKVRVAVWSKENKKSVAWLAATEGAGVTSVVVMTGTR